MSGKWKPEQYHDEYREALMAFIEKKAKSGGVAVQEDEEAEEPESGAEVVDMMEMLKKSVEGRGGAKAKGNEAKPPAKGKAAPAKKSAKKATKKAAAKAPARKRATA